MYQKFKRKGAIIVIKGAIIVTHLPWKWERFFCTHPDHERCCTIRIKGRWYDDVGTWIKLKATAHFSKINVNSILSTVRIVSKVPSRQFFIRCAWLKVEKKLLCERSMLNQDIDIQMSALLFIIILTLKKNYIRSCVSITFLTNRTTAMKYFFKTCI